MNSHTQSITLTIENIMLCIEFEGYKLRKPEGRQAELTKGKKTFKIKYQIFAGLKRRKLIEKSNNDYWILSAKGERMMTGKLEYHVIHAITPEWVKKKELRETWKKIKSGEIYLTRRAN